MIEYPYDPATDSYDVPAFNESIEATKVTAIYGMHSYHQGKKPHDAIRQYIHHYTQPGDLVLDLFCGSGSTALAALIENRAAIAIDRSPAATFITKNYCTPVDITALKRVFADLQSKVKLEIDWLYETQCDRCDGKATTTHTVYSQVFLCPRCLNKVPLFDCTEVEGQAANGKPKKIVVCPFCHNRGHRQEISTRTKQQGAIPVLVGYKCECACEPRYAERRHNDPDPKKRECFQKYDLGKLAEIEARNIPYWYPRDRMMNAPEEQECWGVKWRSGTSNFRTVDELFTKRNLWALAAYYDISRRQGDSDLKDVLFFGLNSIVLAMSRMQGYVADPRFPNQLMRGTYYTPQISKEYNVSEWLDGKLKNLVSGYSKINNILAFGNRIISTQAATNIREIPMCSIDYIFTDPPYGSTVQYGELNFVWEAWLQLDTHWHSDEVIVNEVRSKSVDDWANMMRQAMAECFRVLKPGRWLSLCYHDTSEGTWSLVQDIMQGVGFIADVSDSALYIDTSQKSFNQRTADKVTKRDLVINFRKPRIGEMPDTLMLTGEEDESTFRERAQAIIREYLIAHPGITKDRIYDHMVSRMVRAGQMESHNFDGLLQSIAQPVADAGQSGPAMWYLRETENAIVDQAETAKEDAIAAKFRDFVEEQTRKRGGVHYSDLFERYLFVTPVARERPRRSLAEWLPDYFPITDTGLYRLPTEEEAARLAGFRADGVSRRIKRYVTYLEQGVPVPLQEQQTDATIAQWISHCRATGLYGQGCLLYEKGGVDLERVPEEQADRVEMDYSYCARRLAQADPPKEAAKGRRKSKEEPTLF